MVLWLAEASGIPKTRVAKAKRAALRCGSSLSAQSAAIRQVIPWQQIANHLDHAVEESLQAGYDRITTTIEREWLAQIIAGIKKIEYRQIKPHWTKQFERVSLPFELCLRNGMTPPVPEVTVLIHRITKDRRAGEYQLHIKKVLGFKHWDKRRQKPKR
jgi:hypothetical protein